MGLKYKRIDHVLGKKAEFTFNHFVLMILRTALKIVSMIIIIVLLKQT